MTKNRSLLIIFFLMMFMTFFTSCREDDGTGYIFKHGIIGDPQNLDPQLSNDDSSIQVVSTMFLGLVSLNENGEIIDGIAKDYDISSDGLIYTFYLYDNYYWRFDGGEKTNVTANDFLFTFQRLADKNTGSPHSQDYFSIENLSSIYNGFKVMSRLGVTVIDDYTLEIVLKEPNPEFLSLMAKPSSFPCNEEYFYSTKGKYGLEADFTPSNGAFYLTEWQYDPYGDNNYLILRSNPFYSEVDEVYPYGLNFFIVDDKSQELAYFPSTTNSVVTNSLDNIDESDVVIKEFSTSTSGVIFNFNNEILQKDDVRKALLMAIDKENLFEELPEELAISQQMIPPSISLSGENFVLNNDNFDYNFYDGALAEFFWYTNLTNSDKEYLFGTTIIASQEDIAVEYYESVSATWSKVLGFYCPIETLPQDEYEKRINSGDFFIAIGEITSENNSPKDFLDNFLTENDDNISSYSNLDFDTLVESGKTASSIEESLEIYHEAEQFLLENAVFIPIFSISEYFVYSNEYFGLDYLPFVSVVDFKKGLA